MRTMDIRVFDPRRVSQGSKEAIYLEVIRSPGGDPIGLTALTIGGDEEGPVLVVSAGVHGDEFEGPLTIIRLFQELHPRELKGTFVGLTVSNVPAFEAATRSSPLDGLNLARVFPGDPKGSITQQIAYWMGERLISTADLYIDLHSSGSDAEMAQLCGYNMGSGPAAELRRKVAESFHAEVVWAHPDHSPGRTLSYALEHNIPAVYTECPSTRIASQHDVTVYARGCRNAMRVLGMLDGELEGEPSRLYLSGAGDTDAAISVCQGGFFLPGRGLLEWVEAGDVLGTVIDLAGEVLEEVRAPCSGYVAMRQTLPVVHPGKVVYMLTARHEGE